MYRLCKAIPETEATDTSTLYQSVSHRHASSYRNANTQFAMTFSEVSNDVLFPSLLKVSRHIFGCTVGVTFGLNCVFQCNFPKTEGSKNQHSNACIILIMVSHTIAHRINRTKKHWHLQQTVSLPMLIQSKHSDRNLTNPSPPTEWLINSNYYLHTELD